MAVRTAHGPTVQGDTITFTLRDPKRALERVRLLHELRRPREIDFERRGRLWRLELVRPNAYRLEYMLELTDGDGNVEAVCDPSNPLRAPGPFGDKSVVEMPEYRPPVWIDADEPEGDLDVVEVESRVLRTTLEIPVWSATGAGPDEPLPLLLVHDGPEYAEYSLLLRYLDWAWGEGQLPTMRAALLPPPGDRNDTYSAAARYARALAWEIVPALTELAPAPDERSARAGMGASLGALAMLHAHRLHPHAFGALFLQSGSYFRQRYDPQESGFGRFRRITRFVGEILGDRGWYEPIPVKMTCGTVEENLNNNRAVARALAEHGYDVDLVENLDAHNWTAWRDTFDPHLAALLRRVFAGDA